MEANNQKIREALKQIYDYAWAHGVWEIEAMAKAALAEPARNCDVGTAEAQDERFKNFCLSYYEPCNVDGECWRCPLFKTKTRCPIAWAQMPYEEKGNNADK